MSPTTDVRWRETTLKLSDEAVLQAAATLAAAKIARGQVDAKQQAVSFEAALWDAFLAIRGFEKTVDATPESTLDAAITVRAGRVKGG